MPEKFTNVHCNPLVDPNNASHAQSNSLGELLGLCGNENLVSTTKYSIITFLPIALFEQFRRIANLYFTVVAALSLTELSPVHPFTTITPVVAVIGFSMVKEGIEDFRRYIADKELNHRKVLRWNGKDAWESVFWKTLTAGDVVKVLRGETFPADLICLSSTLDDGICYVETVQLDGETNIKVKRAMAKTMEDFEQGNEEKSLKHWNPRIECELPNKSIYTFTGNLIVSSSDQIPGRRSRTDSNTNNKIDSSTSAKKRGKRDSMYSSSEIINVTIENEAENDKSIGDNGDIENNNRNETRERRSRSSSGEGDANKVPILPQSVLLRGASLRNTDYVIGVAIFTGHSTKIMMNSSRSPSKRSTIEKKLDKVILFMFALLFTLCTVGAVATSQWTKLLGPDQWYLDTANAPDYFNPSKFETVGVTSFFTSFILYGYLIPISLYISIEFVKILQAFVFINLDIEMYCGESDTPASARTSNLNEELGMVHTVLSDKTGTLTRNIMEFFKCSINGISYGSGRTEIEVMVAERSGIFYTDDPREDDEEGKVRGFNLNDRRLNKMKWLSSPEKDKIGTFFRILSICHTVIPETVNGVINYQAESPDEEAFVIAAAQMGFRFVRRTPTSIFIEVTKVKPTQPRQRRRSVLSRGLDDDDDDDISSTNGKDGGGADNVELEEFEILNIIEFNSFRKRMSVIYRDSSGKIFIACKGADTVIYERLKYKGEVEKMIADKTGKHLEDFGSGGLRTLCIAQRELDNDVYDKWQEKYVAAANSMVDRQEKLDLVGEEIEKDLELIGASAIEDKLQDKVPNTIQQLRHAGIRVWVLTGDKLETAINIGYACSLLDDDMTQYTVNVDSLEELQSLEDAGKFDEADKVADRYVVSTLQMIARRMARRATGGSSSSNISLNIAEIDSFRRESGSRASSVSSASQSPSNSQSISDMNNPIVEYALCITGKSLKYALKPGVNIDLFQEVSEQCKSVICCRVSPSQKAEVTTMVKKQGRVTLGIGDGANDVGMIQAAHIGVGISGQEGMQAVMASDFAIAQFKFLERLLLVHGRWNYLRITKMVVYFFYKNILFGLTLFYFNAFAFFSGQIVYNAWSMAFYNVIFTVFPVLVIGALDQDVSVSKALLFPRLYEAGIENAYFRFSTCAWWMLDGVWQSLLLFSIVFYSNYLSASEDGHPVELWNCGTVLYTSVIIAVHLRLAISLQFWTRVHHVIIFGSVAAWFVYLIVYGAMDPDISNETSGLFIHVTAPTHRTWFVGFFLAPVAVVLPSLYMKALNRQHNKADHEIIQEVDSFGGYIEGRLVMYGRKSPNVRKGRWSRRRSSIEFDGGERKKYSGYAGGAACDGDEDRPRSGSGAEYVQVVDQKVVIGGNGDSIDVSSINQQEDTNSNADFNHQTSLRASRASPALAMLDNEMKTNPYRHKKEKSKPRVSLFSVFSRGKIEENEVEEQDETMEEEDQVNQSDSDKS